MPAHEYAWLVIALSLIAVVYVGLVALVQEDMKKLIAYSSISHMGFVTLGTFIAFALVRDVGAEDAARARHAGRDGADDLARLRLRRDVLLRRRALRPHAQPHDPRLRRRHQRDAVVRDVHGVLRDGQLRPAGHQRVSSANSWSSWRRSSTARWSALAAAADADHRRRLHAVAGQARDLRRSRQRARRRAEDLNGREWLVLGVFAAGVLLLGLWPKPLIDLMEPSIALLAAQLAATKL
jgi:NADH-quinone oxidoreductase subunit M